MTGIPGGFFGAREQMENWPRPLEPDPICGECRQFPVASGGDWLCPRCRRKLEAERASYREEIEDEVGQE